MIITLLAVFLLAKLKHYKIRYLFCTWSFYPIFILQCILIFLQGAIFTGNYYFIQYASVIETLIILSFVFPLLAYQLYKPAFIGTGLVLLGSLLNRLVIGQNNGKMPVFPTLSYLTGYVHADTMNSIDNIHIIGSEASRLKFLADYIDVGYSILSPGDLLIHSFTFIMLYCTIRSVNLKYAIRTSEK